MVSSKNFKYKKWAEKINPPQHLTKNLNTPPIRYKYYSNSLS